LIDTPFIEFPAKLAPAAGANIVLKFRISGHIAENLTFTFRAGFPNKTGGVTYFGDPIDIPVNKGAPISKPLEKAGGGLGNASGVPTPIGDSIPNSSGGVNASAGAGTRGISGGNDSNPPPVTAPKKMLKKEEY
jgi:hypothetical protein